MSDVIKNCSKTGESPNPSELKYGQLAINYADGVIYYKKPNNTIGAIGSIVSGGSSFEIDTLTGMRSWTFVNRLVVSAQDTEPREITFKTDGTKMFLLGNAGNDITEFNLSTPWDISTAVVGNTFSVATQETTPLGIYFKPNGLSFYIAGDATQSLLQYNLTSPWDITTATYFNNFSVATIETDPQGLWMSNDGTRAYLVGSTTDKVQQFNLSTPWDITTCSLVFSFDPLGADGIRVDNVPQGVVLNNAGTKLYVIGSSFARVYEYTLNTPWELSSITVATPSDYGYFGLGGDGTILNNGASGIYYAEAASRFYVVDYSNDSIYAYRTDRSGARFKQTNKLFIDKELTIENDLTLGRNLRLSGSMHLVGNIASLGTYSGGVAATSLSSTSTVTFSQTTQTISIGTGQTTGVMSFGGAAQTGTQTFGQSTATHTFNVAIGATVSGSTKTINIGTGGVSGSTTAITIGSVNGTTITAPGGLISFTGTTSNTILWNTVGVEIPTVGTRSVGTKLVLYPQVNATAVDYALGISSSRLWYSIPSSKQTYAWYAATTAVATLSGTGVFNATDFIVTSDRSIKKNLKPINNGLEIIKNLNGYEFDYTTEERHASGLIAQEVEKYVPHAVIEQDGLKRVSYSQLIAYLVEAVKEQQKTINTLQTTLNELVNK